MPSVSTVLTAEVPPGQDFTVQVPLLRQGDIDLGTGALTIGGFPQTGADFGVDFANETIHVTNTGANPWAEGAAAVVTWEGIALEQRVLDMEATVQAGGADVTGDVAALTTRVETHEWQLNGHEARISTNTTKITALEARVAALEAAKRNGP